LSIAGVVSQGMTEVLRWVYWWNSTEDEPAAVSTETVQLQVNADFDTSPLSAKDILALVQAWQAGALSRDTLHHQFQRGELLPPGRTLEEEVALVKLFPSPASSTAGVLQEEGVAS
jgi:hypothetical protein